MSTGAATLFLAGRIVFALFLVAVVTFLGASLVLIAFFASAGPACGS